MSNIVSDNLNGLITISYKFSITSATGSVDFAPVFAAPGDQYTVSFVDLENVTSFTNFTYDTLGMTDNRFLRQEYRLSRDNFNWTEWYSLNRFIDNFPLVDSKDKLSIDIRWTREGNSTIGNIRLLEYNLVGKLERNLETEGSTIYLRSGDFKILKAPFIYKVFRIDDIEVISSTGIPEGAEIKWRFSQDNSRTWSNWEPFTKENATNKRINPIRFFQVEYLIENNSSQEISIQDVNIVGDFQNVSQDYFKTNLFGIRECCQSNLNGYYDANGNFIPNTQGSGGGISGSGGQCATPALPEMSSDEKAKLYNPYQQNVAFNLLNKMSADAEQVFGHKVIYFVTDPDKKGQDHTMHEYQLYNVVCEAELKVSVDGNNFPDSQILMNQFDLSLFESMNVHITKKQFKELFGPQRRPSKEDFLYFCNLNRMFQVEHAQQFRNFNNSAVYYKLVLKKYSQKANVIAGNVEIQNKLTELTKNSTIDQLFGVENDQDKASIANKDQFKPLTREPIRLEVLAEINKELIENSTTIISKGHYDLSTVDFGSPAVIYKNLDPELKVSDNIGFQIWFNLNNYIIDEVYSFMNYYDEANSIGWQAYLLNDTIHVQLNSETYHFDLSGSPVIAADSLFEEVWYCYVVNIDQRQRKLEQYIYKRDVEEEEDAAKLDNTFLNNVYKNIQDIEPIFFEMEGVNPELLGSDMKVTNIRLFSDVIPESEHNKILNQYIIRDDSKYLVFADNATARLILPNFPYNE